jgi:hypothetical protein
MAKCGKCGSDVTWEKKGQRWFCKNMDGEDHWDSCSKTVFAEIMNTGEHFIEKQGKETVHGYKTDKHGKKAYLREGTIVAGKGFKPVIHNPDCYSAPWETCSCSDSK